MQKTAEQEVELKLAIRDLVVRNPLISGHQLRRDLAAQKFTTAQSNPRDWFYVATSVRKLNPGPLPHLLVSNLFNQGFILSPRFPDHR